MKKINIIMFLLFLNYISCSTKPITAVYHNKSKNNIKITTINENNKNYVILSIEKTDYTEAWEIKFNNESPRDLKIENADKFCIFKWEIDAKNTTITGLPSQEAILINGDEKLTLHITYRPTYAVAIEWLSPIKM